MDPLVALFNVRQPPKFDLQRTKNEPPGNSALECVRAIGPTLTTMQFGKPAAFDDPAWIWTVRNSCNSPREALAALLTLIERFTDDELCWVGVDVVEAIVDCGWPDIRPDFEAALQASSSFRKAASCAGPQSVEAYELIQHALKSNEDVGRTRD